MMVPLVESSGTLSCSRTAINTGCRILAEISALKSSVFRLPWPGALFFFFKVFIAAMISCLFGGSVFTSRSVSAS